jgi:hypothetical protein
MCVGACVACASTNPPHPNFNVRERGDDFRAGVMFPETRIGAIVEPEKDFDDLERTLTRIGRERGWKDVARLAGLRPTEDEDESTESILADMARLS